MNKLFTYIFLFFTFTSFAQLLDDSTKQVYGIHSVRYQFEEAILSNDTSYRSLDSSLYTYHIYNETFDLNLGPRQDLGALGSPSQFIYPYMDMKTGLQLGMENTNYFSFKNESIRYFDTKSPYSELSYFQNFKGQEYFDALFTRSNEDKFNFGLEFSKIGSNRQIGANPGDDSFIDAYRALGYFRLKAFKDKYEVLANIKYYDYEIDENGGVYSSSSTNASDSLFGDFNQVRLLGISSQDRRSNYHLYQSFSLDTLKSFQVFHSFDREKRRTIYKDSQVGVSRAEIDFNTNGSIFPLSLNDTLNYDDSTFFVVHENRIGVKGNLFGAFMMGYVMQRSVDYSRLYDSISTELLNENETYFGGRIERDLMKGVRLNLDGRFSSEGYVLSQNSIQHNNFDLGVNYSVKPPSLIASTMSNNHFNWSNDFLNQRDIEIKGSGNYTLYGVDINASFNYLLNTNLIYYNEQVQAEQAEADVSTLTSKLGFNYSFGNWRVSNELFVSTTSDKRIVRIPSVYNHLQVAIKTTPKRSHYKVLIGADIWSRSSYYGNAYMPNIQQFYLQDEFLLKGYTWADVFVTLEVKSARIFMKLPHVTQGLMNKGYFVTPFYYGAQRVLELGFNWKFYD